MNITEFGVMPSSNTHQTEKIQAALDTAAKNRLPLTIGAGVYITGTLFLPSNLNLVLEKGAYILGSDNFNDYSDKVNLFTDAVDHLRGRSLIYADGAENITISGEGVIDGRGGIFSPNHPHHFERPFLVRIMNSKNISLHGIMLKNPAAWTLHLMNCENINIEDIKIQSRVNGNNDGIDIDACRHCLINNCFIDSGDDAICLKTTVDAPCADITVKNCLISTNWAGFKIGTESVGDFSDIRFENSTIYDCNGCAIKICPVDGGNLDGLTIKNIKLINSTGPIFIANGDRLRAYQGQNRRTTESCIKNIVIDGLYGDCINAVGTTYKGEAWGNAKSVVCVSGTDTQHIENITLKNLNLKMDGNVLEYTPRTVPPMGKRYPEFHNFGILPAWGLYVRNCDNFSYDNIDFTKKHDDIRDKIIIE